MRHRLLSLALACALLLGAAVPAAISAPAPEAGSPEEQAVLTELFTLGRSLEETRAAMAKLSTEIAETSRRQSEAATERDNLELHRKERQGQLGRRLRYYQEHGRVAPVALLMGSSSLVDFLSRIDLLTQILDRDAQLIRELRTLKAAVTEQEQRLTAVGDQLEQLRAKLAADEAKLQAEVARREATLAALQEKRAAVEASLAAWEKAWAEQGEPVLMALGETLNSVDPATFEPDQVSLSLFPPGATALISAGSMTQFFGQVKELQGLTVNLKQGAVIVEGQFQGTAVKVGGQFAVADKTLLIFEPQEIQVGTFQVPPASVARLLAENRIEIDVSQMISPWVLKSVDMRPGELRIRAGMK